MNQFKKTLILTRTILKGEENTTFAVSSLSGSEGKKKKRSKRIAGKIFGIIGALVIFALMILLSYQINRFLPDPMIVPRMTTNVSMIFTVFFGFLYTVTTLYYSKDLSLYLSMPLRQTTIVAAKQIQLFLQLVSVAIFTVPLNIGVAIFAKMPPLFYVYGILQAALVVIPIMCLMSIIVILLMRFTRMFRNKDRFARFAGIITIVISLGMVMLIQSQTAIREDGSSDYTEFVTNASGNKVLNIIRMILIPSSGLLQKAFVHSHSAKSLLYLLGVILITLAYIALLMLVANKFYLAGAINMQSDGKKKKNGREGKRQAGETMTWTEKDNQGRSASTALLIKDLKMLVRVPSFFTNTLLGTLSMPIILVVIMIINLRATGDAAGLAGIRMLLAGLPRDPQLLAESLYFIGLIIIGTVSFMSATNSMISLSAISREGGDFYWLKIMPITNRRILAVKLAPGLIISLFSWIVVLIPVALILKTPPVLILPLAAAVLLNTVTGQFVALLLDLKMTKLDWTSEIQLQKRSGIVFAAMGILIAIAALQIVAIVMICKAAAPTPALIITLLIALPLLCAVVAGSLLFGVGPKMLAKISE